MSHRTCASEAALRKIPFYARSRKAGEQARAIGSQPAQVDTRTIITLPDRTSRDDHVLRPPRVTLRHRHEETEAPRNSRDAEERCARRRLVKERARGSPLF